MAIYKNDTKKDLDQKMLKEYSTSNRLYLTNWNDGPSIKEKKHIVSQDLAKLTYPDEKVVYGSLKRILALQREKSCYIDFSIQIDIANLLNIVERPTKKKTKLNSKIRKKALKVLGEFLSSPIPYSDPDILDTCYSLFDNYYKNSYVLDALANYCRSSPSHRDYFFDKGFLLSISEHFQNNRKISFSHLGNLACSILKFEINNDFLDNVCNFFQDLLSLLSTEQIDKEGQLACRCPMLLRPFSYLLTRRELLPFVYSLQNTLFSLIFEKCDGTFEWISECAFYLSTLAEFGPQESSNIAVSGGFQLAYRVIHMINQFNQCEKIETEICADNNEEQLENQIPSDDDDEDQKQLIKEQKIRKRVEKEQKKLWKKKNPEIVASQLIIYMATANPAYLVSNDNDILINFVKLYFESSFEVKSRLTTALTIVCNGANASILELLMNIPNLIPILFQSPNYDSNLLFKRSSLLGLINVIEFYRIAGNNGYQAYVSFVKDNDEFFDIIQEINENPENEEIQRLTDRLLELLNIQC